jgi:hypothetical protein
MKVEYYLMGNPDKLYNRTELKEELRRRTWARQYGSGWYGR